VLTDAFPISVDSTALATAAATESVAQRVAAIREQVGNRRILLGVDRLDYTKGISRRLVAFETLLSRRPELAADVVFVQIVVPSRENVPGYSGMRASIEQIAGRINGMYTSDGRVPVHYHYANLDQSELVAYYRAADAMIVTPPRDGMNLVAKEYVACQVDNTGVLVLSEFAGAAFELTRAVLVNPYDIDGMAAGIERALEMPASERRRRMRTLRAHVLSHDVHRWARSALGAFDA
jgi:trehalose-6-phosphate synthase